jgi:spore germination protein YaaH
MRRRKLRKAFLFAGVFFVMTAAIVGVDAWTFPARNQPDPARPIPGEHGIWLRYTWYFGQHSEAEERALAIRLERHGLKNAFFHVRSIEEDGSLKYRYPEQAKRLVRAVRSRLRPIAWIYAGNPDGMGKVDLTRAAVRRRMVEEAVWLVKECGFAGIQWDYEICPSGDKGLIDLLKATRSALPQGSLLSVAAPVWMPADSLGWSEAYFARVARECDQIAVMCYDTGMIVPRAYAWLVRQQVERVTAAVAGVNPACKVLFGLPAYEEGGPSHNQRSETLAMGLRAVQDALRSLSVNRGAFGGVSPFAEYTMDEAEWRLVHECVKATSP